MPEVNRSEEYSCSDHPNAPHGFNRSVSHTEDRYVCDCEGWTPERDELEIKKCPFCGSEPVFPEAKEVYGTFYEAGCEDCRIPTISIQIIDCFDRPRNHVHDSYDNENHQYGIKYIEIARSKAIESWNKRTRT